MGADSKAAASYIHTVHAKVTVFLCVCIGNEGWRQIYKVELVRFTLMMYNIPVEGVGGVCH